MPASGDTPEERFGAELRRLRERVGLTGRQLAQDLHRAHSGIVEYERGRRLPSVEVVEQYEDYFGLTRGTLVAQRERARIERLEQPRDGTLPEHLGEEACPYKGLRAFEADDAELFFGRERQVQEVLEGLAQTRFVAVVGASGSGKSSFVRAGLIAAIGSAGGHGERVKVVLLTPGEHPVRELAEAVATGDAPRALAEALRGDPDALAHAIAPAGAQPIVIVVDQFEELFTLCDEETERHCFVDALIAAWRDPSSPVSMIVALRADFYGRVASYPELADAVVAHQTLIGPMSPLDLRRAIELPAARSGLLLQAGLVDTMLEDLAGEPGALPLLSHALLETWKRRQRLQLTVGGYREAGGVRGAIAQTAEHTLRGMSDADRAIARSIFLSLTDLDEGAEPTGRRIHRSELAARPEAAAGFDRVLGVLADARLVSIDEATVVVAHEALIRHWPRLRGWIDADRAGLQIHRRLSHAARDWDALDREQAALYRGARLAAADEWATGRPDSLGALERDFLTASRSSERRRARRRGLVLAGMTLAFGVSVVLAILFYGQRQAARSQTFAVRAIDAAQRDPEEALELALDAAELGDGSLVSRALREAVAAATWTHILRDERRRALNDVAFSPDGRLAVAGGDDGTAGIWDVHSGRRVASMRQGAAIGTVDFDAAGRRIVTAAGDGAAMVWNRAGRRLRVLRPGGREVRSAEFDESGRQVITATAGGNAQVWDLTRNAPPVRLAGAGDDPLDVTPVSRDGAHALTPGAAGELRLWTISPRPEFVVLRTPIGTGRRFTVAAISPDGARVLAGDDVGTVCVWALRGATKPSRSCYAQSSTITDAEFSADGALLVTASAGGTAEIHRVLDGRRIATLRHDGPVNAAAFSPVEPLVVTAGDDRLARIWTTRGRPERTLAGHNEAVVAVRFSSDGARVLTASDDGSARVWMTRPDVRRLPGPALPGADVAFSPDSKRLLAVDEAGHAALWDLRSGTRTEPRGAFVPNDAGLPPCDRFTGCAPWSPDSRSVAGASASGEATIWDARSGAAGTLRVSAATGAAFSPDGGRVVVTRGDGPALVVDRSGAQQLGAVPRGPRSWVPSALFTPDGRRLLTVDLDGRVVLSDASRGTRGAAHGSATVAGAAAMSDDGSRLAVGTRSGALEIYDVHGGPPRASAPQGRSITRVAFDRSGRRIVTASDDRTAQVWDTDALGAPKTILRGHRDAVLAASFSRDGRLVLTAGLDGTARLWDPVLGTGILSLSTSTDGGAQFSPDGRSIAIGGRDTVEVHRCELCEPFDALVRIARARLPAT